MTRYRLPALVLCLAIAGTVAHAQETLQPAPVEPTPLSADDLSAIAAGESVKVDVLSNQQLTAASTSNTINADTVTNGDISFSPGALTGFSGVGNFVSNTGNNNTLQGSISITIVTVPGQP